MAQDWQPCGPACRARTGGRGGLPRKLAGLEHQRRRLTDDLAALAARQDQWSATQESLGDLEKWYKKVVQGVRGLSYAQRRVALTALQVTARVWRTGNAQLYEITATIGADVPASSVSTSSTSSDTESQSPRGIDTAAMNHRSTHRGTGFVRLRG